MKPQDLAIALALCGTEPPDTYAALGGIVGLSTSEAHGAVKRLREAGLVDARRQVLRRSLYEFLRHGIRVVFPMVPGGLSLGVPTGAAVFPDEAGLPEPEAAGWVWPHGGGDRRGLSVAPLYSTLPGSVVASPWLHELLALVDLLRAGRAREVTWARNQLQRRLGIERDDGAVDLSAPDALRRVFGRSRIAFTISKWLRERRRAPPLVQHPMTGPLLAGWRDELAHQLATDVTAGLWSPSPAAHVVGEKPGGGARDWAYPSVVDAIVGRRLIDELEPHLRRDDGQRVFVARSRTSSRRDAGAYDEVGSEWTAFLDSLQSARLGFAFALKTDLREFFATVDHGLARQLVAQRSGAHPQVIDLLFRILAAWMPSGHLVSRGLPIEPHDVSRLVAHALLKVVDDEFEDSFELRYRRFMDDTVVFCESPDEARRIAEHHRRVLLRYGLQPNLTKLEVCPSEELVGRFDHREETAEIAAEVAAGRMSAVFEVLEWHTAGERARAERALFWSARRQKVPLPTLRVLDAVGRPEVRDAALAWVETQVVGPELLAGLLERYAVMPGEEGRLRLAQALGRADASPADELLRWSRAEALRTEPPWLATALALIVFKHGAPEDVEAVAAHRHLPGSVRRLLLGAFAPHEHRASAPTTHPDEVWTHYALDVLVAGRVPRWRAFLWELGTRPEHLPLLHWVAHTCPPDLRPSLRARLGRLRGDAAAGRHVQQCLARVAE